MRQKTVKIKLFAQMTIGVTRISDSSRCPHNTSGHRDDIPPKTIHSWIAIRCEIAGGTTSASSALQRSERVDPAIMLLGAICPGISRSERVDPAIHSGVKPVDSSWRKASRYIHGGTAALLNLARRAARKLAQLPQRLTQDREQPSQHAISVDAPRAVALTVGLEDVC